jgi:pilus assembly protein CpaF
VIPTGIYEKSLARFLSPIAGLMNDFSVSEIMVNGPFEVWVERSGRLTRTPNSFGSREALDAALTNIAQFAGRPFDQRQPILEAHLPDGSRVEAILPPVAENGPLVAIRRFLKSTLTLKQLVDNKSLTIEAANFVADAVREKATIVISGGTGSGKTSLLGALSALIGDGERVVVIEDTREVQLQKPHVVYLETRSADEKGRGRITIRDLLRATLRLRPDRIVVGEVRGGEALDLIQAMTSGHSGSMTTTHANTPLDVLRRIETMAMMSDTGMTISALRAQVISAVDLIVQIERTPDGMRRVSEISRVQKETTGEGYAIRKLFFRERDGRLVRGIHEKGGRDE